MWPMVRIGKHEIRKGWFTKRKMIAFAVLAVIILGYCYYVEKMKLLMRPTVTVAKVRKERVPVYLNFVSNTVSKKVVDIRARVEGFLQSRSFTEGDDVEQGQLLYVIDKRPFEAALAEAKGQLAKDRASLAFAAEQVKRYKPLAEKDYVSQNSYDNYVTQERELKAAVEADIGGVEQAELNLSWCTMRAPFSGRIGRTLVNTGNLVGAGGQDTKLATLVMLDPIYAYFSPSDEQYQKIMQYADKGELKAQLMMADGSKYAQLGVLNFVDNEINKDTSTVAMRVIVPNPEKILLPGLYLNLDLVLDETDALLIPKKAVSEDQVGQYVLIVMPNEVVKKSYVTVGAPYGEDVAVTKGVNEGDAVIVGGLQIAQPGTSVNTKSVQDKGKGKGTMQDVMSAAVAGDS